MTQTQPPPTSRRPPPLARTRIPDLDRRTGARAWRTGLHA